MSAISPAPGRSPLAVKRRQGERLSEKAKQARAFWGPRSARPQKGKKIAILAQIGKSGWMFLPNRETGQPIFGVEERPLAKCDVPGEWYSTTQPFPLKPGPLARVRAPMGRRRFILSRHPRVRAAATANPMTHLGKNGKQDVAIAGGTLEVFVLP